MSESPVYMFDNSDPEMQAAYEQARANFRYFWREIAWERRRIIPGLDLACVKAPFSDGEPDTGNREHPSVEHMWMNEVDFDGKYVSGVLLNSPNWLKSVKEGDSARIPLKEISDWMYAMSPMVLGTSKSGDLPSEVFGAYSVNLLRSRMSRQERQQHDEAWGLNFGDPKVIRVTPWVNKAGGGLFSSWFGKRETVEIPEHPMSENMGGSLKEALAANPEHLTGTDDRGFTLLHQQALAGSAMSVQVLLDAGADVNAVTSNGMTPLMLAKSLGWEKVIVLLTSRGAK
jgi:uncharacterized protein YegJ (DUF2314 family)